jgi:hypothetical protein
MEKFMGLFNFLKYNKKEKALLNDCSQIMSMMFGISSADAKKIAEDTLDRAIEASKKEGTYYLPENFGDIILGDAGSDNPTIKKIAESIRHKLPMIKKEGVREEDVRWWWNLNDIERHMMLKEDENAREALFIDRLKKDDLPDKAAEKVRKFHLMYGDPDDTSLTTDDDRPLPYELKDRINNYIQKRIDDNSEKYKNDIEQSSTFNALIRKEIKAGNL